jgi:DNA-binding MarR family transcriptional regulator
MSPPPAPRPDAPASPGRSRTAGVRWLDDAEQAAWRAFLAASQLLMDQLDRELQAEAGIPHTYYEILVRLSEAPDRAVRMSDLAERCQSSRSRLSHAVARLEDKGWVQRAAVPSDRRGAIARLTDEGFAALEAAAPIHVEGVRSHVFDQLRPAQVAALAEISQAIYEHLTAARRPPNRSGEHTPPGKRPASTVG